MLLELVFSYYTMTTEPAYLREPGPPMVRGELALNVEKPLGRYGFLYLKPFVKGADSGALSTAGAEVEAGIEFKSVALSFYHKSEHNLDRFVVGGEEGGVLFIQKNGIRARWRLK